MLAVGFYLRSFKQEAYRNRLGERFGRYDSTFARDGIVIHGASVGEIITLQPFIERVISEYANLPITVTTFTPTGSKQVFERFGENVQHCYLPIDATKPVKRFLSALRPRILVLMETEIWPTLIDHCRRQQIKVLVINARISTRSFPRYQKLHNLIAPTLRKVDHVLAQSTDDSDRFVALGANASSVSVSGNMKYDLQPHVECEDTVERLKQHLGDRQIWVVGSSHDDEESLLLNAYQTLRKTFPALLMVLAPRHPERISPLESALKNEKLHYVLRSENILPAADTQVWIIDTMGELLRFYQLATVCTIAGSFGKTGGHNPLEACLFAKPIVVGSNMANFQDISEALVKVAGISKLEENSSDNLVRAVSNLLSNQTEAALLGKNAASVLTKNRGALDKSLKALQALLM